MRSVFVAVFFRALVFFAATRLAATPFFAGLLLGGLGGTMIGLGGKFWNAAIWAVGKFLDGSAALHRGIGMACFRRLIKSVKAQGAAFS